MTPCASAGLEPGWMCQWRCLHCYYVRDPRLGTKQHKTLDQMKREVDAAKARGCNRIYLVGNGEPTLYPFVVELVQYATDQGMGSAVITNGAAGIPKYEKLYAAGLDHVHVSMHGVGEQLSKIAENKTAGALQDKFLRWLSENRLPFRTNTTVQKENWDTLDKIAEAAIGYGCSHFVVLGFLPHYDWQTYLETVAVPPAQSAPYVQKAADVVLSAGRMLTLRYQPHCLIDPKYWPYIVNARYVPFDPWEWENGKHSFDAEKVWQFALQLGDSVAVRGKPCSDCAVQLHCGGWNRVFASHFGGCGLRAVMDSEVPEQYLSVIKVRGGLHDLNPANHHSGFLRTPVPARTSDRKEIALPVLA